MDPRPPSVSQPYGVILLPTRFQETQQILFSFHYYYDFYLVRLGSQLLIKDASIGSV